MGVSSTVTYYHYGWPTVSQSLWLLDSDDSSACKSGSLCRASRSSATTRRGSPLERSERPERFERVLRADLADRPLLLDRALLSDDRWTSRFLETLPCRSLLPDAWLESHGCARAVVGVRRSDGSTTNSRLMKSLAVAETSFQGCA